MPDNAPDPYRARYEQWVGRYAPELYRFAYRLIGSPQMAEDLVQETFAEAWKCIAKQREPGKERAWLFQILRYRYSHHVRKSLKDAQLVRLPEEADELPATRVPSTLERMSEREAVKLGLDALSPDLRKTFLMVFAEDLTCRETAEELKIPLGTVLSRLDSARKSLRKALERIDAGKTPCSCKGKDKEKKTGREEVRCRET